MKDLNISKVISDKRREKGVTQDQLALYIGVSKASVSKWETGQSYPDITFLPQLAAYFNISIDDLIGYTPQMTKEDIKTLYRKLSVDFSSKQFDEVIIECQQIVKKYYSCFPLLMQMSILLCNHHMLAENLEKQKNILNEAIKLCVRIKNESSDPWLIKDAISMESTCYLMLGKPQNVLELLGETIRPISDDSAGIAQAYLLIGNLSQANKVLQISLYQHLLCLVGQAISLMQLQNDQFEEILHRILTVSEVFDLENLHPNSMALAYLNAAQGYCVRENKEKALDMLEKYTKLCVTGFSDYSLHGDLFFTEIEDWFKEFDLGGEAPRSKKVIQESMLQGIIGNPAFECLKDYPQYKNMVTTLKLNLGEK